MKIGLALVATGKYYDAFVPQFLASLINFIPEHNKTVYIFTDKKKGIEWHGNNCLFHIHVEHKPFPYPTLMRYHWISSLETVIDTEYLFYSDVDMRMVKVGKEILQPLVAVLHPGFYQGGGSWEINPTSTACVLSDKINKYYAGGFQGGGSKIYIQAAKRMRDNIQTDLENGVVAVWHDESHWNKYLTENPFTEFNPSYCYPETASLPFEKKILALDKDHNAMRF